MKYTVEILLDKPLKKVIELFDNPENMSKWMEGLQSYEFLEGTPGHPGSKMKLKFKMGKREMEMIETITVRNLPYEFSGTYDANGVHNIVRNFFSAVSENQTLYTTEQEFQFKGFMRLIGFLFPGAFKKQSMKYLQDFKRFVENAE